MVSIKIIKNGQLLKKLNVNKSISLVELRTALEETIVETDWCFMDGDDKIPVKREGKYSCEDILDKATNQVLIKTFILTTETEIFKDNIRVIRLDLNLA